MNTRTVHFYGKMAKKYGKKHEFSAENWFQLLSGFVSRFGPQIKNEIKAGSWALYDGKKKVENNLSEDEFKLSQGVLSKNTTEFHLVPEVKGKSGVVRFIIGVVLIVVGVYFGQTWLVNIGISLALGGIVDMLTKQPTQKDFDGGSSSVISTAKNVTTQGGPMPMAWGRVRRVSSVIINSDFQAAS